MDLLECVTAIKCGTVSITQWAEATQYQLACAKDYMQMVMYSTGVVLKIPVQRSCSYTKQLCYIKGHSIFFTLLQTTKIYGGKDVWFHAYLTWHNVEVTLGRGKQAWVLTRQEPGLAREAVLKL